jgi:hypothetical protein
MQGKRVFLQRGQNIASSESRWMLRVLPCHLLNLYTQCTESVDVALLIGTQFGLAHNLAPFFGFAR